VQFSGLFLRVLMDKIICKVAIREDWSLKFYSPEKLDYEQRMLLLRYLVDHFMPIDNHEIFHLEFDTKKQKVSTAWNEEFKKYFYPEKLKEKV